jgi:CheY-like chemotaxis protein
MNSTLLLVEDNEDDAFFLRRALQQAGVAHPLQHMTDGQSAIDYLAGAGRFADRSQFPLPALVLLDLNLPYKTGLQVLEWLRAQPALVRVIVVVLTSSSEPIDVTRAYALGANAFVVKPSAPAELLKLAQALKLWWLETNFVGTEPRSM